MSTAGAAPSIVSPTLEVDDAASAQRVVVVYNCTRLGLTANPPGFSLLDLFRFGRRRR
ncbi:MAG: hypothetical protein JWR11_729 [Mycobacterium sp.]|jgi:hypothetical protein|nr:hypothetical protein [Mycobacterium sp.]MDT5180411.1 hypothetical protein [Mycobacterium sp.]